MQPFETKIEYQNRLISVNDRLINELIKSYPNNKIIDVLLQQKELLQQLIANENN